MATIEYYKLEQRDNLHTGQKRYVHRLKNSGRITAREFINKVTQHKNYSPAAVTGMLIDLADELARLLAEGHSVELPNVGIFSVGVRMKDAEDIDLARRNKNARSLEINHINFRKNNEFYEAVCNHFRTQNFRRTHGDIGVRIRTSRYPQVRNRMIVAREFLATHPVMTIRDYAAITGLSYSTAQRELKRSWSNPDYGITIHGAGSHRVYILRKEEETPES
jgi:predicted histone-like DNA-binding protein